MKALILAFSLLLAACSEFCPPAPDYVGLCNKVALEMGDKQERLFTPPIVFVRDSYVLGSMFAGLQAQHSGERLIGVYSTGMIYLSQADLSNKLLAHEYAHYFGADEARARQIGTQYRANRSRP